MVNERLKNIERPQMSEQTKARQLREITGNQHASHTARSPILLPKVLTVIMSSLVALILLFIVGTSKPPSIVEDVVHSVVIEDIAKVKIIPNSKPKKLIDVSSPFYLDRKESVNEKILYNFEKALQNVSTVPFSWDGLDVYQTDDILFELASGEQLYIKSFMTTNSGEIFTVNMQTMEQYVMDGPQEQLFWQARNDVFVENPYPSWPIFGIALMLIYFVVRQYTRSDMKAPDAKEMPGWIQFLFVAIIAFSDHLNEMLFGAHHSGFALMLISTLAVSFYYINMRFYNTFLTWWNLVEFVVWINIVTLLFGYL